MQLKQMMTKGAKTIGADAVLVEAARQMRESDVGALPVVQDGSLCGIVTDRDITIRATASGRDPNKTAVKDVMTREVFTCPAGSDVGEAVRLMEEKQVRRIVVTDTNNHPVGVVSLGDIALDASSERIAAEALREVSKPD
ncbi:MAG: CBS domain-containing protein [Burkholderiales bacterium]|nr:CBS domain-containing protein [Burkholderiales bacterium]